MQQEHIKRTSFKEKEELKNFNKEMLHHAYSNLKLLNYCIRAKIGILNCLKNLGTNKHADVI